MSIPSDPTAVAEAIASFFATYESAGLRFHSGWFGGRPFDNLLRLTGVEVEGEFVRVTLDETQVLTLDAHATSLDASLLCVTVNGGSWDWIEYGTHRRRSETLEPGIVEFHSPLRR